MSIDFQAALTYPFREPNRRNMVWIPGFVIYGLAIGLIILFLLAGLSFFGWDFFEQLKLMEEGDIDQADTGFKIFYYAFQLLQSLPNLLIAVLAYGYLWQLCGRWQTEGYDAPPVDWLEDPARLLLDGLKLMLYYVIASLFVFLPLLGVLLFVIFILAINGSMFSDHPVQSALISFIVITLGILLAVAYNLLVGPFLNGPIIASARNRKLAELFNLKQGWQLAVRNYKTALWSHVAMIGLGLAYLVGLIILMLPCCLGLVLMPFCQFAFYISWAHLANQGLWRETPPAAPQETLPPPPPQIVS